METEYTMAPVRDLSFNDGMQSFFERIPIWRRYIDNIFFVWTGSRDDLSLFFESLKSNQYNLTFTMEAS